MLEFVTGLPRWAWGIGAGLGLLLAVAAWLHFHDRAVIENHEAEVTKAVTSQAAQAGDAAHSAVSTTQTKVEQQNDEARKAAAGSDDPLRAGFDRLRERPGADKPAAR